MKVIDQTKALGSWRARLPPDTRLALVPTMGALHEGHLALIKEARRQADLGSSGVVAVSIFVNPTQFGPNEDYASYPRTLQEDVDKAKAAGADLVFAPQDAKQIYPHGEATTVQVQGLEAHLCGAHRPGHFAGVCTVVLKLWQLFLPSVAVFGQKDFQQLAILRQMHRDLFLGGEIVAHPIVREADGLAMSSRNLRLDPAARQAALEIVTQIREVQSRFASGARRRDDLLAGVAQAMAGGELEYCELVDALRLEPLQEVQGEALFAVAARYGGVRLIDNCLLSG